MANQRRLGAAAWLVTATCALAAGCGGSDGNVFSNPDAAATSDADAADSGTTPTDSGSSGGDTGIGTEGGTDAGVCPATVGADLYVAPTGSDTTGNGSATCPFVTITKALSLTTQSLPAGALRWTVNVQSGSAAVPNLYGTGCTAGIGKCDAPQILVTDSMNKGIVIKGSAIDPSAAVVQSAGADAVFVINAPNVGFQNLTIAPTRVRAGGTPGALGIRFAAPVSATTEAAVTNIVIAGITKSTLTEPTGAGIEVAGGTSPTIGPGVTIIGGTHSLLVTQAAAGTPAASRPVITSTASAPTLFRAAELACVRIESANAAAIQMPSAILNATAPNRRHLMDCGGSGAIVVDTVKAGVTVDVTNTLIDATTALPPTPPPATNYGIRLLQAGRLTVNGGLVITGITELVPAAGAASAAIEAGGTSTLTINGTPLASPSSVPNVSVTNNKATGVHVLGNASATITGLSSTSNKLVGATGQHGLLCDAAPSLSVATNLTLRGSLFLDNEVHGVFVRGAPGGVGCAADLGSAASVGANIYNTTTLQNGKVGLCYTVVSASGAVASSSAWGCGLAMSVVCTAAMAATPKPTVVANCDSVGDYNAQPGAGGLAVALPQMCCGK